MLYSKSRDFGLLAVGAASAAIYFSASLLIGSATASPLYRSIDGSGNNIANPTWGATGTQLKRLGPAFYGDGVSTPAGGTRPSAREVSNAVSATSDLIPNSKGLSNYLWQWGQFLDHDIDLTHTDTSDTLPISVPSDDPVFSSPIGFSRSTFDPTTGEGTGTPRQQTNVITSFIDASNVYGSDAVTAAALRAPTGGKLLTTPSPNGDLLLTVSTSQGTMFMSGDERANEQTGLTVMHTLFMREHNRIADELIALRGYDPVSDNETIYQEARKLVGAMMQAITYNEFLPALLGSGAPGAYTGYDPSVDPSIANEFSTAAYRFGHSTLSPTIKRLGEDGKTIATGDLQLKDAFFTPSHLLDPANGGIEPILRGLASQMAQEVDPMLIDAVRNMLFGPPVDVGFDLAALNIQRGRDHGLPSYNDMRDILGLGRYADWDEVVLLPGFKERLMGVYDTIDDVDLLIGGLAEVHQGDGMLGELFAAIIRDQFERLRVGDRFWYQNGMFEQEWLDYVEASTLDEIIMRNTSITWMQSNVFLVPEPGSLGLLFVGFAAIALFGNRTRSRRRFI